MNGRISVRILEAASRNGPSGCLGVPALSQRVAALFFPWSSSSISMDFGSATSHLGGCGVPETTGGKKNAWFGEKTVGKGDDRRKIGNLRTSGRNTRLEKEKISVALGI